MITTVSISDFRENTSLYLEQISRGDTIVIKDTKRNRVVAHVNSAPAFHAKTYRETLRKVAGSISAKRHPEWRTRKAITTWLINSRLADDRTFD